MNILNTEKAVKKLNSGLPIIFHTDTVPAIGCLPNFSEVIYKTKKRERNKPLILMAAENHQLKDLVHETAVEDYDDFSSKYWPGALTMIIPIAYKYKKFVTSSNLSLGLRIPNSLMARELIKKTGPLLTSSANLSGSPSSSNAESISKDLPGVDILGPLPWQESSGKSSTIISWVSYKKWMLVREGEVVIPNL